MNKLHQAIVLSHRPAGREYYRLVLKAPDAARSAKPGQFVMVRVTGTGDPLLARPFGISTVLSRTAIEIVYRVVGRGTRLLTGVRKGQSLTILGPLGNGFPLPGKGIVPILVGGGSGFPPLHFFAQRTGKNAHFFIGARNRECLPPAGMLKSFREVVQQVHIATDDGSAGVKGMSTNILSTFLSRLEKRSRLAIYACGPHAMLAAVARIAAEHLIPCQVSLEERMACGLGACMGCSIPQNAGGYKRACKDGPVFDANDIDWSERIVLPVPHKK